MKKIPDNQIDFYQSPDRSVNTEVLYAEENIWLTQKKMAELFDTTPQNITQHLKNIYLEGEVILPKHKAWGLLGFSQSTGAERIGKEWAEAQNGFSKE